MPVDKAHGWEHSSVISFWLRISTLANISD